MHSTHPDSSRSFIYLNVSLECITHAPGTPFCSSPRPSHTFFNRMYVSTPHSLGQYPVPLTDPPNSDTTLPTDADDLTHSVDAQNLLRGTIPCFYARDGALEAAKIPKTGDPVVSPCQDLMRARGQGRCRHRTSVGIERNHRCRAGIDQTGWRGGVHERPGRSRK